MSRRSKRSKGSSNRLTRRNFLETGAAAAAVGAAPPLLSGCGDDSGSTGPGGTGELKILQWNHFVPQYDSWFDPYATSWGEMNGVDVTVEHVRLGELNSRFEMEKMAGEGHDLIEFIAVPAAFEPDVNVQAMAEVNASAEQMFGRRLEVCRNSSFNPVTGNWYGFCHGWVPDPGNFRRSLWMEHAGMPDGPSSWQDLLDGGRMIKNASGVPIGIGMSNELDSNMATRALLWSFGATIQDAEANVTLPQAETEAAIEFMKQLTMDAMDIDAVNIFDWSPSHNNQELIAGNVSYIVNSISAYRTAQGTNATVAQDVFFTRALTSSTTGMGFAGPHVVYVYVIPSWARNVEAAKDFLLSLVGDYSEAVNNSQLYNLAAFPDTAPDTSSWLAMDPFDSMPEDKLSVLQSARDWTRNTGQPGPANAAAAQVFSDNIIPTMFRDAVMGNKSTMQAVSDARAEIEAIYETWRTAGLVG